MSITTRPNGKILVFTKCAMREEMVPRGFPGNARFMLTPSSGDVTAQASCNSGYVCFWEHVNHGGYSISFYHCALRSLDRYFMPNGDDWAYDISSWIDSQTGGTYATVYRNDLSWLGSTNSPRNQPWVGARVNDLIGWVDVCSNA